jgi:hypothetical protein
MIVRISLALAALAAAMQPAAAATVVADFAGRFDAGDLAGRAFAGRMVYDDAAVPLLGDYYYRNAVTKFELLIDGIADPGRFETNTATVGNRSGSLDKVDFLFEAYASPVQFVLFSSGGLLPYDGTQLPNADQLASLNGYQSFASYRFANSMSMGAFAFTSINGNAVPEPAGWVMMIAGVGGIGAVFRRRPARVRTAR